MQRLLVLALVFFTCSSPELVKGRQHEHRQSQTKLFVFGDSYADTGNWKKDGLSWKMPYGVTYPGKPAGRFSDGRILTDYIASYMRIKSPIPYQQWNARSGGSEKSRYGINFAHGGTGVFDTDVSQPNMTSQINIFERLKVYSKRDLHTSIALVSLGGNDYSNFLKHGPNVSLSKFTKRVVKQLVLNLKRIRSLGVAKIAVTSLEPIGCLPAVTILSGYKNCSQSLNEATSYHNQLLQQSVERLNKQSNSRAFFILDLYAAFMSALHLNQTRSGNSTHESLLLKPCCQGTTFAYDCGSVEGNAAKYRVCDRPDTAFFWDTVHPAQHGWNQVYLAIQPALKTILHT